jgi:hypothetical protein
VGVNPQSVDILVVDEMVVFVADQFRGPQGASSERPFKLADSCHRHRVDHLLVKLRVPLRWRDAVERQQIRIVEVHRVVETSGRWIEVDDFQVFAHRPFRQTFFPRHMKNGLVDPCRLEPGCQARVEGVNTEPAVRGFCIILAFVSTDI